MRAGTRTIMRSFLWLSSATMFAKVVDLVAIIVVLGVVSPAEVGAASIVWTVLALTEPFASFGVQWGLLSVKQLDRVGKDSALWLAAAGGVITSAVVALLAPLIALVFAEPLVTPLMVVGALKLLPAALACVPQQRLARVLKHREIAAASVLATLASALLRIFLALQGAGAWAFVLAQVAYSLALLLALWALAPMRPRFRFDHAFTRELFTLGMPTSLSNALTQWARNIDYVFVGALLGTVPLGLYRVAFDLAMEPVVAAGDVMARSVAPNLRRLASSYEELSRGFGYAVRVTFAISLPLAIGTFVFAPHLLELTQDASFLAATSATRWLIVAALLRVMLGLYTPLAVALGRPGLALRASSEQFVLLIVSLGACIWLLGDTLDIASAGVAWCIALGVALYINHLRFREVMHALAPAAGPPVARTSTV